MRSIQILIRKPLHTFHHAQAHDSFDAIAAAAIKRLGGAYALAILDQQTQASYGLRVRVVLL